ncbi:methyltransferase domain protein [Marvinbryantia formatexigens DSM 14469]|uniref:Methyltransferase domain protein n=1 Tax=Marvinbryantia formatexigens DSM 14469 TaxID=478749 RepID=C6LBA0_9FIRM|nr:class I SAM-dependent methyltransferase [Marvinbryantia formatexigens]EET62231.1 methyltransferase domain protein [Marvinbryantia formatexigens DSM 14469]UWO26441.1 class I SAM-dependent methyltransferase [Marvinbryantia formatexigens DSM 14469]SDF80796.1 Methyltransferase domain-containing protein [Marvinbryantia formatexigens]
MEKNSGKLLIVIATVALAALLLWMAWIRKQYAFGGGGMMDRVHQTILSYLEYDGKGKLLEVGCGSGALAIRAAKTWPEAKVTGVDYWGSMYNYSKELCEKNARLEGVGSRCVFQRGDANKLEFPDETFDAVVSNYVYHNITGSDKHELLLESLRVLKKGGVFALHDSMKPRMYTDMKDFVQKLKDMGYQDVRLVSTSELIFGSEKRAVLMMLENSKMLIGRK